MDLVAEYSMPLPLIVFAQMPGIPDVDRPRYLRWSEAIFNTSYTIPGGAGAEAMSEFRAITRESNDYLAELTKESRVSPKEDLLTRLVQAEEGEIFTQNEIVGVFQLLLVGGQETTTNPYQ
jgi:cytochrome P450